MEMGVVEYISFKDYKTKAFGVSYESTSKTGKLISNNEIEKEMMELVKYYEQKKKVVK